MAKTLDASSQTLAASLFTEIQREILSGEIRPESKLTEQSICKKYKVSRTPVREAFMQLEAEGLITNIPNRGAFVIGLTKRDISDIFDLRCLFEVQAVEWAIKRMSEEQLEVLKETIDFMEFYTLKKDVDKVLNFNSQFHNTIYEGTCNRMLQINLATYQNYLKHSAPSRTYTPEILNILLEEHRDIYNAISSRDVTTAKKAMKHHMQHSKERRMSI